MTKAKGLCGSECGNHLPLRAAAHLHSDAERYLCSSPLRRFKKGVYLPSLPFLALHGILVRAEFTRSSTEEFREE